MKLYLLSYCEPLQKIQMLDQVVGHEHNQSCYSSINHDRNIKTPEFKSTSNSIFSMFFGSQTFSSNNNENFCIFITLIHIRKINK